MKIRKADWIIFIVAVALFGTAMLIMHGFSKMGDRAVVLLDGEEIASFSLDEDTTYTIKGSNGEENVLVIRDHQADIVSANCPDQSCVHQKTIRANGESIVCLPHRVVVLIRSMQESEVDAVAQ